ncbi:hypothetical protein [Bacillus sp. 205(2023)]
MGGFRPQEQNGIMSLVIVDGPLMKSWYKENKELRRKRKNMIGS